MSYKQKRNQNNSLAAHIFPMAKLTSDKNVGSFRHHSLRSDVVIALPKSLRIFFVYSASREEAKEL